MRAAGLFRRGGEPEATVAGAAPSPQVTPAGPTAPAPTPPVAPAHLATQAPDAATTAPEPVDPEAAARQREIDEMVAQALTAPQMGQRTVAALQASEKAVAGLADTIAAIDAAQRVVADNLRNVGTVGYKAVRPVTGDGRAVSLQLNTEQGELENTGRPLDLGIQGDGFFQVQNPAAPGGVAYTRCGNLFVNNMGELVVGQGDGYRLLPPVTVPPGAAEISVAQDGTVNIIRAGQAARVAVGRITLARCINASGLRPLGKSLYGETEHSGKCVESVAGEGGAGFVMQGFLEASNVDLTRERLRLRFLQNWREAILRAIDGSGTGPDAARAGARPD